MATVNKGKNWKVLFDKGTSWTYVSGKDTKGHFRKKDDIRVIARRVTNLMFVEILKVEKTTVEEDNNPQIDWN